jgi:hypothetical protein
MFGMRTLKRVLALEHCRRRVGRRRRSAMAIEPVRPVERMPPTQT